MNLDDEVNCLRSIPLFANIESPKLKLLAFASDRLIYQPGDILCEQGEQGNEAFIILKGEADILIRPEDGGAPLSVATLGAGEIVGEIAILCDKPRTATIRAHSELTVLSLSKDLFYRTVMEFPQVAVDIMRTLALRLERTTAQLRPANPVTPESPD